MKQVILYTKKNCPLCEEAKQLLLMLQKDSVFVLNEVDIYEDDNLLEKYQLMIPVVEVDGIEVDYGQINMEQLLQYI
ncbi:glutaredoxin family protein [Aquibacillus rhizosphaerae]|uniref:Glutaredoxin family protein n=1 Tax=Aquibacillus rhizosphaerae TaxID=3051431 RepID=A0ABT7L2A7_9BACI|nr:glutaredoxin family protein [Aquibacillus sp. LR5S19]MDL4839300.1 glutaredoxin family protein [Aquibacillus sp. LR5S19]